ncbi:high mobility group protein B3, putative [Plasmodium malariae]|uniref:High mobility group protein B3, putative n=1 Tax=Plasmodium malariae TaxID=5858 RepID=A0A1C3KEH1_PLAMA|nr:high mobility group protein B3, putative [Plasmodium malariae]
MEVVEQGGSAFDMADFKKNEIFLDQNLRNYFNLLYMNECNNIYNICKICNIYNRLHNLICNTARNLIRNVILDTIHNVVCNTIGKNYLQQNNKQRGYPLNKCSAANRLAISTRDDIMIVCAEKCVDIYFQQTIKFYLQKESKYYKKLCHICNIIITHVNYLVEKKKKKKKKKKKEVINLIEKEVNDYTKTIDYEETKRISSSGNSPQDFSDPGDNTIYLREISLNNELSSMPFQSINRSKMDNVPFFSNLEILYHINIVRNVHSIINMNRQTSVSLINKLGSLYNHVVGTYRTVYGNDLVNDNINEYNSHNTGEGCRDSTDGDSHQDTRENKDYNDRENNEYDDKSSNNNNNNDYTKKNNKCSSEGKRSSGNDNEGDDDGEGQGKGNNDKENDEKEKEEEEDDEQENDNEENDNNENDNKEDDNQEDDNQEDDNQEDDNQEDDNQEDDNQEDDEDESDDEANDEEVSDDEENDDDENKERNHSGDGGNERKRSIYKFYYNKIKEIKSNMFIKRYKNSEKYIKKKIFNYLSKNNIIGDIDIDSIYIYVKNVYYIIIKNEKLLYFFLCNTKDVMNAIVKNEKMNKVRYIKKDFFLYFLMREKEIYAKLFNQINTKYENGELLLKLKNLRRKLKKLKCKEENNLFEESMQQLYFLKRSNRSYRNDDDSGVNISNNNINGNVNNNNSSSWSNNKYNPLAYRGIYHRRNNSLYPSNSVLNISLKNLIPKLYNCKDFKETNNLIHNIGRSINRRCLFSSIAQKKKKKKKKKDTHSKVVDSFSGNMGGIIGTNYANNFDNNCANNFDNNCANNFGTNCANNFGTNCANNFGTNCANNFGTNCANNFGTSYSNNYVSMCTSNYNISYGTNFKGDTNQIEENKEVKKKSVRGITSFTLFAREKRKELLNQKVFLGSSLTEQTSAVAKIWNSLSNEKKKEWAAKASKINEENFLLQKKKKKRKFTAFSIFAREKRKEYKEKNIDMGITLAQQNSYVSKLWKQLSNEEKNRYKILSNNVNAAVAKNYKSDVNCMNGERPSGFKGRIKALDNMMSQHFSNNSLGYNINGVSRMNNVSTMNNISGMNGVNCMNDINSSNMSYIIDNINSADVINNSHYVNDAICNLNKSGPTFDNTREKKNGKMKKKKKNKQDIMQMEQGKMMNNNYMYRNTNSFYDPNYNPAIYQNITNMNNHPYQNGDISNNNMAPSYNRLNNVFSNNMISGNSCTIPFQNDNKASLYLPGKHNNVMSYYSHGDNSSIIGITVGSIHNTSGLTNPSAMSNINDVPSSASDNNRIQINGEGIKNIMNSDPNVATAGEVSISINKDNCSMNNDELHNNMLSMNDTNMYNMNGSNYGISSSHNNNNNIFNSTSSSIHPNRGYINNLGSDNVGNMDNLNLTNRNINAEQFIYHGYNKNTITGNYGHALNEVHLNDNDLLPYRQKNKTKVEEMLRKKMKKDEKQKLKEKKMMMKLYDKRRKQLLKAEKLMEKKKKKKNFINGINGNAGSNANSYSNVNHISTNLLNGNSEKCMYYAPNVMNNNDMSMNPFDVSNTLMNNSVVNNFTFYSNLDKEGIKILNTNHVNLTSNSVAAGGMSAGATTPSGSTPRGVTAGGISSNAVAAGGVITSRMGSGNIISKNVIRRNLTSNTIPINNIGNNSNSDSNAMNYQMLGNSSNLTKGNSSEFASYNYMNKYAGGITDIRTYNQTNRVHIRTNNNRKNYEQIKNIQDNKVPNHSNAQNEAIYQNTTNEKLKKKNLVNNLDTDITNFSGIVSGQIGNISIQIGNASGQIGNVSGQIGNVSGQIGNTSGQIGNVSGQIGNVSGQSESMNNVSYLNDESYYNNNRYGDYDYNMGNYYNEVRSNDTTTMYQHTNSKYDVDKIHNYNLTNLDEKMVKEKNVQHNNLTFIDKDTSSFYSVNQMYNQSDNISNVNNFASIDNNVKGVSGTGGISSTSSIVGVGGFYDINRINKIPSQSGKGAYGYNASGPNLMNKSQINISPNGYTNSNQMKANMNLKEEKYFINNNNRGSGNNNTSSSNNNGKSAISGDVYHNSKYSGCCKEMAKDSDEIRKGLNYDKNYYHEKNMNMYINNSNALSMDVNRNNFENNLYKNDHQNRQLNNTSYFNENTKTTSTIKNNILGSETVNNNYNSLITTTAQHHTINLNETMNSDLNMNLNYGTLNYVNNCGNNDNDIDHNHNNNNNNNNTIYFYPHNSANNGTNISISMGSNNSSNNYDGKHNSPGMYNNEDVNCVTNTNNLIYYPGRVFEENKLNENLVYFDADIHRIPGVMEDTEVGGPKEKQFFNNASHFLELVNKKIRRKKKKKASSVNDVSDNGCTIWDLVIKNRRKRNKRKDKKDTCEEHCGNNSVEGGGDRNESNDINIFMPYDEGKVGINQNDNYASKGEYDIINCIFNNTEGEENAPLYGEQVDEAAHEKVGKEEGTERLASVADVVDVADVTDVANPEDPMAESNCDDFLNFLNACSSNYSNKLNINENGEIIYDDKRKCNSNNLINENYNCDNLSLLMNKKKKINQNLNNCQIEKYNNAYKKNKLCKWTNKETEKFYEAIEMFGIDLMMVRALMPKFSDKQIRDKYKREKKINPSKIEEAIKKNKVIDLDAYENENGKIDNSTHYKYYESTSSSDSGDNNSVEKNKTWTAGESEINILSIFDDKEDEYNMDDYRSNQENPEINILTLF